MSTSPPRKQSIQWSTPTPTAGPSSRDGFSSESPRRYRDLTPHPKKFSGDSATLVDRDSLSNSSTPATPERQPQPPGPLSDADPPSQHWPTRMALPRRSSTMNSGFSQECMPRTLSQMEEGGQRPRRRRENGNSVVADLLQFGLKHGIGRGIPLNGSIRVRRGSFRVPSAATLYEKDTKADGQKEKKAEPPALEKGLSYVERCRRLRERRRTEIVHHVEDYVARQKFIIRLAKTLLSFGAPSHRIESQLHSVSEILDVNVAFVHLPNLIICTFLDSDTRTSETHFVRAGGRVALTKLHKVHLVYRDVLHDKIGVTEGCVQLKKILQEKPLYSIWIRCLLAFFCASIICVLSFGGSIVDMFISGLSASVLQYLGLNAASKSTIYANVYEISVSIVVSFIARLLGTLPGNLFCYSAISSAGVVLILPGFTILIAALELTSRNILCGSVRMVYAIIYTLFLGFGLTIGSDFYLLVNPEARHNLVATAMLDSERFHGFLIDTNITNVAPISEMGGTFTFMQTVESGQSHIIKGCYRNPAWPWYRQPFPWWSMFFLVPLYSTCSSIGNLQAIRSLQLPIMVAFSCAAFAANRVANLFITDRGDIVSAFGAFVIGLCGNTYSRVVGGTAFTSMVPGVLFLVPSAIGSGGGLIQNYNTSAERYSGSFELGIRMIQVAIGVTIGLFVAQILVYALGRRKSAAHFAF